MGGVCARPKEDVRVSIGRRGEATGCNVVDTIGQRTLSVSQRSALKAVDCRSKRITVQVVDIMTRSSRKLATRGHSPSSPIMPSGGSDATRHFIEHVGARDRRAPVLQAVLEGEGEAVKAPAERPSQPRS